MVRASVLDAWEAYMFPRFALLAAALLCAVVSLAEPTVASPSSSGIVISELRLRGPAGGNDELIELANTSSAPVDLSGWKLVGCSATAPTGERATIPAGTRLPAGAHLLLTNVGSSGYSGAVAGDVTYTTGISDTGGAILRDAAGATVDAVGATTTTAACREGAGLSFPTTNADSSFERSGADTDRNEADFVTRSPSSPQACGAPCAAPVAPRRIGEVQGAGASSPLVGQTVTIRGVVTGIDNQQGVANYVNLVPEEAGVWVQSLPSDEDADPASSEGVFVADVTDRAASRIGRTVTVTGKVREHFGLTEVDATAAPTYDGAAAAPAPVTIDPARASSQTSRAYYESLEGMRVRLATGTADSGGTNKFGELFLRPGTDATRVFRGAVPADLIATAQDAGSDDVDPGNPSAEPASTTRVNADLFDRVDDVVGPLAFSFSHYKVMVQPGMPPAVTHGPTPFPWRAPAPARETLRFASFNVENHFPAGSVNDGHTITQAEYEAKRDRIVDAIANKLRRPDVVGVQEVVGEPTLADLAAQLGDYTAYMEPTNDARGIAVGFLVKDTVRVTGERQLGKDATTTVNGCSDGAADPHLFNRPPLAIDVRKGAFEATLITNHWASQSHPDACRDAQAQFLHDEVLRLEGAGEQVLVSGDLNTFESSTALTTVLPTGTSLTNLWSRAPDAERYSYAFSGALQTLDHVFVTDRLAQAVTDVRYAHFDNDYYERDTPGEGTKVSDHDPPLVTFAIRGRCAPHGHGSHGRAQQQDDERGGCR
jgi:predicted extracellular nuclease